MGKKKAIILGVVVLAVVVVLCWLVIPGSWVSGVDRLTGDSVVTASRYQQMEEDATPLTLTQQQTQELRELLEGTVFFRRLTSEVRSQTSLNHCDFTVTPSGGGDPVYVRCTWGSGCYLTVSENGKDTLLKPVFSGWEEKLEQILDQ